MDELFKTIFGNEKRKNITARFLNDLIDLNVNANDITFVNNELLFNEYQPNQKRPVVDINMIISSNSNNNLEATSSNSESLRNEKIENKKVIVEMQVFNDPNFLTRIIYNTSKLFVNSFSRGDEFEPKTKIISLNILYDNKFRLNKEYKNNFFHNFNINCSTINKKYDNFEIYIVELSRFNIYTSKKDTAKEKWIAFLKCITYEKIKIEKNGEEQKFRIPIYHLDDNIRSELETVKEIKEALEVCTKKPKYYDNYQNLFTEDNRIEDLTKENKDLKEKVKNLENDFDGMKNAYENLKTVIAEMKRKYEGTNEDDTNEDETNANKKLKNTMQE